LFSGLKNLSRRIRAIAHDRRKDEKDYTFNNLLDSSTFYYIFHCKGLVK